MNRRSVYARHSNEDTMNDTRPQTTKLDASLLLITEEDESVDGDNRHLNRSRSDQISIIYTRRGTAARKAEETNENESVESSEITIDDL